MLSKTPIHLLVRYSDKLYKTEDAIREHLSVIEKNGLVWFGKVGKPLGKPHFETINRQNQANIPTFVYLVQKKDKEYITHRGRIAGLSKDYPAAEAQLIPEYYFKNDLIHLISLWLNLSELVRTPDESLSRLRVASSVMTLPETLATSMAALFIVKETPAEYF